MITRTSALIEKGENQTNKIHIRMHAYNSIIERNF